MFATLSGEGYCVACSYPFDLMPLLPPQCVWSVKTFLRIGADVEEVIRKSSGHISGLHEQEGGRSRKLTEADIPRVKKAIAETHSLNLLAKRLQVSRRTVTRYVKEYGLQFDGRARRRR
jgi:hypothetical protein